MSPLQIDEKKVAASAKVTQQDAALVSRVCTLFGLSDQQRTAIANLARKRKLGSLNFDTIERIEKYMRSPRKEQGKRAFDELFEFTPAERTAFDGIMKRLGRKTLTMWRLSQGGQLWVRGGKLSKLETAAAEKHRQVATHFLLNYESVQAATKDDSLTKGEAIAIKKLGESIEKQYQRLFFAFFNC